jgi:hypothetical protein
MIARYAVWAIRGNGIALFSNPTPIDCIVDKGHDDYIVSFRLLSGSQFRALLGSYEAPCHRRVGTRLFSRLCTGVFRPRDEDRDSFEGSQPTR